MERKRKWGKNMEFKGLSSLKEKIKAKKDSSEAIGKAAREHATRRGTQGASNKDTGAVDLTQRLKAAFHEKPKEDPELERRKELEQTVRGFRKSFRQDIATGVKSQVGAVVTEVKQRVDVVITDVRHSITNIKEINKNKKRERDEEETFEES
jgi:hypothetical protein